ncbi:MAG: hypothetical protein PVG07_03045 [Acidobacteriota bacterium]|jgi:hypothetical protein
MSVRDGLRAALAGAAILSAAGWLTAGATAAGGQETPPEDPPQILGAPAALDGAAFDEPRIAVPAGTPLRERPDPRAPILMVIGADSELPELERRGGWVRVRFVDTRGWLVDPALGPRSGEGPDGDGLGYGRLAYGPVEPDPELLARARSLLGAGGAGYPLGPWTLYTDVDDPRLLASLDRLARSVVTVYPERFGLDPGLDPGRDSARDPEPETREAPEAREAVVLFAREEAHRDFLGEGSALAALGAEGYAGAGLVTLARGDRSEEAVRSLLVHELVHLLDRRALGPRTPPWLEEGLAHSMASSRITPSGRLVPEALGGGTRVIDRRLAGPDGEIRITVETTGGRAGLDRAVDALDRDALVPLERLVHLPWSRMVDPDGRQLRYAQSALFVRFLLDGDRGRWRLGFRSYLAAVADGDPGAPDALLEALGTDWATLERELGTWLRAQRLQRSPNG